MSFGLKRCAFKGFSLLVISGILAMPAGYALATAVPGDVCERLGETRMADGQGNLVACLHLNGSGSPKHWKNYFPTNCNEGDLMVFKSGRFVCEKESPIFAWKNYSIEQLGKFNVRTSGLADFLTKTKLNPAFLYNKNYVAKSTGRLRIALAISSGYSHPIPYDHTISDTFWNAPIFLSMLADDVPIPVPGAQAMPENRELFNPTRTAGSSYGTTTHHVGVIDIVQGQTYRIKVGVYTNSGNANVIDADTHQVWAGGGSSSIEFMEISQ